MCCEFTRIIHNLLLISNQLRVFFIFIGRTFHPFNSHCSQYMLCPPVQLKCWICNPSFFCFSGDCLLIQPPVSFTISGTLFTKCFIKKFLSIADMSSSAFIEPLPVIDFVTQLLNKDVSARPLSDADRVKVSLLFPELVLHRSLFIQSQCTLP